MDAGCDGAAPICDESADGGDGECRECADDAPGSAQDAGCDVGRVCDPAGLADCVTCYVEADGDSVGCGGSQVCDAGQVGGACVTCVDEGDGVEDPGCVSPMAACNIEALACVECRNDLDCSTFDRPSGDRCNRTSGTACGCIADADCSDSPRGTHCRPPNASRCGCTGDSDCDHAGSAGPNCSSNTCGP